MAVVQAREDSAGSTVVRATMVRAAEIQDLFDEPTGLAVELDVPEGKEKNQRP